MVGGLVRPAQGFVRIRNGFARTSYRTLVPFPFARTCARAGQRAAPRVPTSESEVKLSFAPVVNRTAPAVVNVYALKNVQQRANPFMDDPFFRRFFGGGPGLGGRSGCNGRSARVSSWIPPALWSRTIM